MARKNVLKGLLDEATRDGSAASSSATPEAASPTQASSQTPSPAPRSQRGAIGAVSRSIADLKARAVAEIDPFLIDAGGVQDRLESDSAEDASLSASILEHGQQVPVLVRPHPDVEGRYQIVYGRRRVLALRDLGQPVKALIRNLDDQELVLAQGQENTARRDLSFIEKVNFARQLKELGYKRKVICDALSVDKTVMSRMMSLADRLPPELIERIGAAPSIGRDRWLALADLLDKSKADVSELFSMMSLFAKSQRSDDRFVATLEYLQNEEARGQARPAAKSRKAPAPRKIASQAGAPMGQARLNDKTCTVQLSGAPVSDGFAPWLLDELPALYAEWLARQDQSETN